MADSHSVNAGPVDSHAVDIDSVVVDPDHCHRCGAALGICEFEGNEAPWCPDCELVLSRHPVPAVHVVVHDDDRVLVLDEPIPQHEGVLSLPGGHVRYDEGPKQAVLRELAEETGLEADAENLRFLTILHVEFPGIAFYLITYALEYTGASGELTPERDGFEAAFRPLAELQADPDLIRDNDLERIEMAFDV